MGCAAQEITIVVFCSISIILFIVAYATPWYVIGSSLGSSSQRYQFYWTYARYSPGYIYSTTPTVTSKIDYSPEGLLKTFNGSVATLSIGFVSCVLTLIMSAIHMGVSRKGVKIPTVLFASFASIFTSLAFLIFLSFTTNIKQEATFCPYTATGNGTSNAGYPWCDRFQSYMSDYNSRQFGPGPGFWVCMVCAIVQIVVFFLSLFIKNRADHKHCHDNCEEPAKIEIRMVEPARHVFSVPDQPVSQPVVNLTKDPEVATSVLDPPQAPAYYGAQPGYYYIGANGVPVSVAGPQSPGAQNPYMPPPQPNVYTPPSAPSYEPSAPPAYTPQPQPHHHHQPRNGLFTAPPPSSLYNQPNIEYEEPVAPKKYLGVD